MRRLAARLGLRRPSPAMVVAIVGVVLGMGGSGYAAHQLSRNSVGAAQIRPNPVGASEIRARAVGTSEIRDRSVRVNDLAAGVAISGPQGALGPEGPPGPATGPAGGVLTGSYPDPGLADGVVAPRHFGSIPSVRVEQARTTDLDVASGSAFVTVPYQVELHDTDAMFDPAQPDRVTFRTPGVYLVTAAVRWNPDSDGTPTGVRSLGIVPNDDFLQFIAADTRASASGGEPTRQSVSAVARFTAGQFVVAKVQPSSGASLAVHNNDSPQVHLSATWLAP